MAITNLDELVANIGAEEIDSISGAGAVGTGTFGAPKTYRRTQDGIIITQIKFDLTGLGSEGANADDACGLPGGGVCYIGQYVVADCGVVFKTQLDCIESPGEGTATMTADINITSNTSAALEYSGAAGAVQPITGGGITIGQSVENFGQTMTDTHYLYITEEDTTAATGVWNAGQYIFTMYGHAVLT